MNSPVCRSIALLVASLASLFLFAGCTALPPGNASAADIGTSPWALLSVGPNVGTRDRWAHHAFPGKTPTEFEYARVDGRDAIAVHAQSSASMLRHTLRVEPKDFGRMRFSWKVPALMAQADLALRDKDDAAVRLVLVFEGDRSRFSARDAALSELAHALTGEPLPYATMMYVWCNSRAPGTVVPSPRTGRIRKLVVESGPGRLNRWLDYERDIRADYERVFGEAPGALVGIAIMTDSDNTKSQVRAWYGPVQMDRLRHGAR